MKERRAHRFNHPCTKIAALRMRPSVRPFRVHCPLYDLPLVVHASKLEIRLHAYPLVGPLDICMHKNLDISGLVAVGAEELLLLDDAMGCGMSATKHVRLGR